MNKNTKVLSLLVKARKEVIAKLMINYVKQFMVVNELIEEWESKAKGDWRLFR